MAAPSTTGLPGLPLTRHTILFLAANPIGTEPLKLAEEAREVEMALDRSGAGRANFKLVTRLTARPSDLLDALVELEPAVVHFAGHGRDAGPQRGRSQTADRPMRDIVGPDDVADEEAGLYFEGPDGRSQLVSADALRRTFGALGPSVKLVVLNACYSEPQASALVEHVDCVVGMRGAISDDAARSFAFGFYRGIGAGKSVAAAYRLGCAAISLEGLSDADRPQLRVRDHIDPEEYFLSKELTASVNAANAASARALSQHDSAGSTREEFDVFLCYNSADLDVVQHIAARLRELGIRPWLDDEQLPPGERAIEALQAQIHVVKAAAVFIGAHGVGPWQTLEIDAFVAESTKRKYPLIPVLLADCPLEPKLPPFLESRSRVDLRKTAVSDAVARLYWGITGKKLDHDRH